MSSSGFKIDVFRPGDAVGVSGFSKKSMVMDVGKIVYDPEEFTRAVDRREYPVVARTPEGYRGLLVFLTGPLRIRDSTRWDSAWSRPGIGAPLVLGLLVRRLVKVALASPCLDAFFREVVCNHVLMQKAPGGVFSRPSRPPSRSISCLLGYEKDENVSGRVSTVVSTRTIVPRPHTIRVPEVYGDYRSVHLQRI